MSALALMFVVPASCGGGSDDSGGNDDICL